VQAIIEPAGKPFLGRTADGSKDLHPCKTSKTLEAGTAARRSNGGGGGGGGRSNGMAGVILGVIVARLCDRSLGRLQSIWPTL
jgi:hypothetical protein